MVVFVVAFWFGQSPALVHISIPMEVLLGVESVSILGSVPIA